MKYWRGYLVAAILTAISVGLILFAKAHESLVDMIYPYMTRVFVTTLAEWSSSVPYCLFTVLAAIVVVALIVTVILMLLLRWNVVQWFGWVLAVLSALATCHIVTFGLNNYCGPLADDIHMEIIDYSVKELNEATLYFRDKALELAPKASRKSNGDLDFGDFDKLAQEAGEGFRVLTYEDALSVFAGSTVPVKKLSFANAMNSITVPLTGESAVKSTLDDIGLPFTICKEMAKRMCIAHEEDSQLAAFLACKSNPSVNFQYSAYCAAYYYCHSALENLVSDTAKTYAAQAEAGLSERMKEDLKDCRGVFGKLEEAEEGETDVADLLACWYVSEFITVRDIEEEKPFNPLDKSQVDLTYKEPEVTPLPTVSPDDKDKDKVPETTQPPTKPNPNANPDDDAVSDEDEEDTAEEDEDTDNTTDTTP